jgi:F-type H+-transporting ATPase subunit b
LLAAPLLAEEASGIGALGIDAVTLGVYLFNFAVLAVILYFLAYKKIIGKLDERSDRIRESLEEADRVRQQALEQTAEMQRTLDEGRQAGQQVLQEAREAAERYREAQQVQARAQAEEMIERARVEIQSERDAALEQVRAQFAGLAVTAAERIIHRSLDETAHRDLIDEVLAEGETLRGQG